MNIFRQAAPAALATALSAALATGLAACGALSPSSSTGSSASSSAGAAASSSSGGAGNGAGSQSASTSTDPLASLTASQIFTKAATDTSAASSVHVVGSVTDSGQQITFTLDIAKGQGCTGALAEGSKGSFKLIVLGKTVWVLPDATFWKSAAGTGASSAVLSLLEGKYLKGATGSTSGLNGLSQLCGLSGLLASQTLTASTVTKSGTSTFGGTPVIVLKDTASNGTADVTDQAQPLLVRISGTGANGGTITFSEYNAPVTLAAPPASEVIDGSKYGF